MYKLTSCGGAVIYDNRVLLLYKNQNGKHVGWVLPKGTMEKNETRRQTALREVQEEAGVTAHIVKFLEDTSYTFPARRKPEKFFKKTVYWYFMTADSPHCIPQQEEFFEDAGFYKRHEAEFLAKFDNEKEIIRKAFAEYDKINQPPPLERNIQHGKTFKLEAGPKATSQQQKRRHHRPDHRSRRTDSDHRSHRKNPMD